MNLKSVGAMTLFVQDPQRSKVFYQNAFGAPIVFEDPNSVVFKFDNVIVNLLADREAPELIAPATVASRDAGSRVQYTIWVEDTRAACAELASRGVELINGPMDRVWGMRTACFADPDGHIWEIAQELK